MKNIVIRMMIRELSVRKGLIGSNTRYKEIIKRILEDYGSITIDSYTQYLMKEDEKNQKKK